MKLTVNETISILPLFIRRDLGALADAIEQTRHLTRASKIEALAALARLANDPDDPAGVDTVLKILGI
jgi:hypothetical protein